MVMNLIGRMEAPVHERKREHTQACTPVLGTLHLNETLNLTLSGIWKSWRTCRWNFFMPSLPGFTLMRCTTLPSVTTMMASAGFRSAGVRVCFQSGRSRLQKRHVFSSLG